MNRIDQQESTLVLEAALHRQALRLERRALACRAREIGEEFRDNPLGLVARGIASRTSVKPEGGPELWIRIAVDVLQLVRDIRRR